LHDHHVLDVRVLPILHLAPEAFKLLNDLASVFRGMVYWGGGHNGGNGTDAYVRGSQVTGKR
jgi:hypothetical protein